MTLRTLRLVRAGEAAVLLEGGVCESRPRAYPVPVRYKTVPVKRHRGEPGHTMYRYIVPYHPCVHVSVCPVCPLCVPAPPFLQSVNKA